MGISLSQKLDSSFGVPMRMITAFGITDEIFALSYSQKSPVTPKYLLGMIFISWVGWTGGTLVGALAGSFLPAVITGALGIMLYAMFVAIVVPVARENKKVLFASIISIALSVSFKYLTKLSAGFTIIICAIVASVVAALLFPISEVEEQ
jgi:predicted branched-subunit amino acid permease